VAKNSTSRQKRANQNRARRAALAARTAGEVPKRPSRIAPATAERLAREPRPSSRAGEADPSEAPERGRGAKQARKPRERAPRLGDRPVEVDALEGSFLRKVSHVPGGLQVIMTVGLAVVVAVITGTQKLYKDAGRENDKEAPFTMTIFEKLGTPKAAVLLAVPVLATFVALAFSLHKQRRRVWIGASIVVFVSMLVNIVLMNFLVVGGFLVYAVWRSQRVEGPAPSRRRRGAATEADEDEDDEDGYDEDDDEVDPDDDHDEDDVEDDAVEDDADEDRDDRA